MVFTKAAIVSMIIAYSQMVGVDHRVALAIAKVESNYVYNAVSPDKQDYGVFQIRAKYHPEFSKKELLNPHTNIILGLLMIKEAKQGCKHKLAHTWTVCYNRGIAGGKKVKDASKDKYVKKVRLAMEY